MSSERTREQRIIENLAMRIAQLEVDVAVAQATAAEAQERLAALAEDPQDFDNSPKE